MQRLLRKTTKMILELEKLEDHLIDSVLGGEVEVDAVMVAAHLNKAWASLKAAAHAASLPE